MDIKNFAASLAEHAKRSKMGTFEASVVACDTSEEGGLSLQLNRYCGPAGKDRYRLQLTINPSSSHYVKLDRKGVMLLIKFLENSLE